MLSPMKAMAAMKAMKATKAMKAMKPMKVMKGYVVNAIPLWLILGQEAHREPSTGRAGDCKEMQGGCNKAPRHLHGNKKRCNFKT